MFYPIAKERIPRKKKVVEKWTKNSMTNSTTTANIVKYMH